MTLTDKANVRNIYGTESNGRYPIRDIAKTVGISSSCVYFILRRILKICLSDVYRIYIDRLPKRVGLLVQTVKQLLKLFPSFYQRQFSLILSGDEHEFISPNQ